MSRPTLQISENLLICTTCGAQYDVSLPSSFPSSSSSSSSTDPIPATDLPLQSCRICEDPRQFVSPDGQKFTTLKRLRDSGEFRNVFRRCENDGKVVEVWTEGKIGIGQRACIIQTPHGNIMWDLIAYLDQDTVDEINTLGGLKMIIISHPHFYTTWHDWSTTFSCPVYMAEIDASSWANRIPSDPASSAAQLRYITETHTEILPGVTAIKAGGHFLGSMMLHTAPPNTDVPSLFVADTIMAVASAHNPAVPEKGSEVVSYAFMWSIPNMIPLDPDTIHGIWNAMKGEKLEFRHSYGVMAGVSNVRAKDAEKGLQSRVLRSMKVFLKRSGWTDHKLLSEEMPS